MKLKIKDILKTVMLGILALTLSYCGTDDGPDLGNKPVADFSASLTEVEAGKKVQFTDLSTNNPSLWTWQIAGANPGYSNQQNPEVEFVAAGEFSVTLTVRNDAGADEITKSGYIKVTAPEIKYKANYEFNGNLTDKGTNKIAAVSNYGDPVYASDKKGNASAAWQGPQAANKGLTIPGYKAIGGNGKRTVMAWFKMDAGATSRNTIVSWGANSSGKMFNIMIDAGVPRIEAGTSSMKTKNSNLNDGNWHHIAVTFDPADGDKLKDVKIFIDGNLAVNETDATGSYQSETTVINTDNSTSDVLIGYAIYSTTGYYFKGIIDDLRILDDVLLPAQIAAIANK